LPRNREEVEMRFLSYALVWVLSLAFTSIIDVVWHLVIFRKAYAAGIRPLARMRGEKIAFNAQAGALAQLLVVTCLVVLVLYRKGPLPLGGGFLIGAMAGILAISVYGLTNYALLKDWGRMITILEVIWGPLLGGLSGAFVAWLRTLLVIQP
jgi:uncharacterized membrane protein